MRPFELVECDAGKILGAPYVPNAHAVKVLHVHLKAAAVNFEFGSPALVRSGGLANYSCAVSKQDDVGFAQLLGCVQRKEESQPFRLLAASHAGICQVVKLAARDDGYFHLARIWPAATIEENFHA